MLFHVFIYWHVLYHPPFSSFFILNVILQFSFFYSFSHVIIIFKKISVHKYYKEEGKNTYAGNNNNNMNFSSSLHVQKAEKCFQAFKLLHCKNRKGIKLYLTSRMRKQNSCSSFCVKYIQDRVKALDIKEDLRA